MTSGSNSKLKAARPFPYPDDYFDVVISWGHDGAHRGRVPRDIAGNPARAEKGTACFSRIPDYITALWAITSSSFSTIRSFILKLPESELHDAVIEHRVAADGPGRACGHSGRVLEMVHQS